MLLMEYNYATDIEVQRKKLTKHNQYRNNVAKKEQSEALTNEVRNRELWDFSARAFWN